MTKKSTKRKRGTPTRKKKRTKKATVKKKAVMKKPELRPLAPSPLLRSFGGKTEDQ